MRHQAARSGRPRVLAPALLVVSVLGLWGIAAVVVAVAMPDGQSGAGSSSSAAPFALIDNPSAAELAQPGELGADAAPQSALPDEPATRDDSGQGGATKRLTDVMSGATVLRVGDTGLPVKFVQQRLNMAGIQTPENSTYDAATEASIARLQEKFDLHQSGRVNRYTLSTLLQVTERGPGLPAECLSGTVLCIDKTQKVVRLVIDGAPEVTLDARFGSFGTATDEGMFTVYDKRADDWSEEFGVPMKYSLYFSGGQAVHYSDFFATEGYTGASRGCVNTRDLAATAAMYEMAPKGTSVFVYD